MSDHEKIEATLKSLGHSIDWPKPSQKLATGVVARIEESRPEPRPRRWSRMITAAAAVGVIAFVFVISPTSRQAVAELFREAGVRIGFIAQPPAAVGESLDLGAPVSMEQLANAVDYTVRLPAGDEPGPPDAIYLSDSQQITMVWAPSPAHPAAPTSDIGLLFNQRPAASTEEFAEKGVGPDTEVQSVTVDGQPALWITGAPHTITLLDPEGNPIEETIRLAANTLLWQAHQVNYRLETTGELQAALEVVDQLRHLR